MANRNANAKNVKIGPAWWSYKGMALGYVQDSSIKNESSQHDTLVDQNGQTPIGSTSLGGKYTAEVGAVELNRGMIGALVVGAESIPASAPYATDGDTGVPADKTITFASEPTTTVQIGDIVNYTDEGSNPATGAVAQYDPDTYTVTLMDTDVAPNATPAGTLTAVTGVKFFNTAGTDLFAGAGVLMAVPTDEAGDDNIYVLPKAGMNLSADFQFKVDQERKIPLTFTGFPEDRIVDDKGNALSFFMGKQEEWGSIAP